MVSLIMRYTPAIVSFERVIRTAFFGQMGPAACINTTKTNVKFEIGAFSPPLPPGC